MPTPQSATLIIHSDDIETIDRLRRIAEHSNDPVQIRGNFFVRIIQAPLRADAQHKIELDSTGRIEII